MMAFGNDERLGNKTPISQSGYRLGLLHPRQAPAEHRCLDGDAHFIVLPLAFGCRASLFRSRQSSCCAACRHRLDMRSPLT